MMKNGEVLQETYQIVSEIGHGGTGVIFLAWHLRLQKYVVLKKIKENFVGVVNERGEVDILKSLHHTYLPHVYDFLQMGSSVYTVMDYVEGHDLQYYMDAGVSFSEQQITQWLAQLCEVLEYLHTRRPPILHSDIKPSNIMITPEGNVCLIDFNISLNGEMTKELGGISAWYAAPEQYQLAVYGAQGGGTVDRRMDIYSLAATFYAVMTGVLPNPEQGEPYPIMSAEIPYSDGLKAVIHRAMCLQPAGRFESAVRMQRALADYSRMDPRYRRFGLLQLASAAAYLCMLGVSLGMIFYGHSSVVRTHWNEAYDAFYVSCEQMEDKKVILQGIDMLNDDMLKGYLKEHTQEKAEILHAIGDGYFHQEDYEEAADYYADAVEADAQSDYYFDYVLALARDGQLTEAKRATREADSKDLDSMQLSLLQAEIDRQYGNLDTALENAAQVYAQTNDAALKQEAAMILAKIYGEKEQYTEQIAVLRDTYENTGDYRLLREAGSAAYEAALAAQEDTDEGQAFLETAEECYSALYARTYAAYEDGVNLAIVERMRGEYEESTTVLQELRTAYPDEYQPLMWLCYNLIDTTQSWNNTSELTKLYKECLALYEQQQTTDSNMEQLQEFMEELEAR